MHLLKQQKAFLRTSAPPYPKVRLMRPRVAGWCAPISARSESNGTITAVDSESTENETNDDQRARTVDSIARGLEGDRGRTRRSRKGSLRLGMVIPVVRVNVVQEGVLSELVGSWTLMVVFGQTRINEFSCRLRDVVRQLVSSLTREVAENEQNERSECSLGFITGGNMEDGGDRLKVLPGWTGGQH